jgi:PII-like signaling protein
VPARARLRKLMIYVSADRVHEGRPVHELLVERAAARGLGGAMVVRGLMGYGDSGTVAEAHFGQQHPHIPLELEIFDSVAAIEAFLPEVYALVDNGIVEVGDVEVVKGGRHAEVAASEEANVKLEGKAKMLRIFIEANDQWQGEPLHEALVKRLRQLDVAGLTVLRGVMGYGANGRVHRHTMLHHDEPMILVVVDVAEKIASVMPAIDQMLGGGMAVVSDVDVAFYRAADKAPDAG